MLAIDLKINNNRLSLIFALLTHGFIEGDSREVPRLKRFFIFFLIVTSFSFAQTNIMRASFSTAAKTSQIDGFTVQHSISHMGLIHTSKQGDNRLISGFLIPQNVAYDSQSIPSKQSIEWSLYPNPFSTHINLDFLSPVSGEIRFSLYDAKGKLIIDETIEAKQKQRIPMEQLAEGIYLINISVLKKSFKTQILKNK
jgi:hypothetical protein